MLGWDFIPYKGKLTHLTDAFIDQQKQIQCLVERVNQHHKHIGRLYTIALIFGIATALHFTVEFLQRHFL